MFLPLNVRGVGPLFCGAIRSVLSSFVIILLLKKREIIGLINCVLGVVRLSVFCVFSSW